jgi:bifunctional pyridoxal-dependent enzyme with beta-cystathionase and maltose regulon repressor activities
MRMNIATSRKTLEAALNSMARALNDLKKGSTAAL